MVTYKKKLRIITLSIVLLSFCLCVCVCVQVWWSLWKWWITVTRLTQSTMFPPERDPIPSMYCTLMRRYLAGNAQKILHTITIF